MNVAAALVGRLLATPPAKPLVLEAGIAPAEVVAAARDAGASAALLDHPRSREETLDALAAGLGFAAWFGRNWDALEETLAYPEQGLEGPVLVVWDGPASLAAADRRSWTTARTVLRHAAASRRARGAGPLVVLFAGERPPGRQRGEPMTPVTVPPHLHRIGRVHHLAVVVRDLDTSLRFYRDTLGLAPGPVVPIPSDRVRIAFLPVGDLKLELVEPTDDTTGVARFLASRGEGFHHVCFEVPDIAAALTRLAIDGVELIDTAPRPGAEGPVAFLHPRSCHGVLVELIEAEGGPAWATHYPHGFRAPGS